MGRVKGTLQERQQARAAGGHPLQRSFRAAAASLLAKHGLQVGTACTYDSILLRLPRGQMG